MKISIITVCLNSVKTIERTIKSVLSQNYRNLEYIIIDGGSADGTLDIIKKHENDIDYFVSEPDGGIYYAMNKGIDASTGDVIAFLNSDDWYEEGTLEVVEREFINNDIQMLCGRLNYYKDDVLEVYGALSSTPVLHERFLHPAIFTAREVFDKSGKFNTKYRISADTDWQLRAFDWGVKYKTIDRVLVNFSEGGISSNIENYFEIIDEHLEYELEIVKKSKRYTDEQKKQLCTEIVNYYLDYRKSITWIQLTDGETIRKNEKVKKELQRIFPDQKYSLFGFGAYAKKIFDILADISVEIDSIWDSDASLCGTKYKNIDIRPAADINKEKNVILISTKKYSDEVEKYLKEHGKRKNKDFISFYGIEEGMIKASVNSLKSRKDIL